MIKRAKVLSLAGFFLLLTALGLDLQAAEKFFREGELDALAQSQASRSVADLPHFNELVKVLGPAVVNISVEAEREDAEDEAEAEAPGFPFFKKDPGSPVSSLGSGFILNSLGYIVTNHHVVRDAKKIIVRMLDDKHEYQATLVGQDIMTDLALIKIEPGAKKLSSVVFGDSDSVEVGEWVVAIGNQFQLGQTVTAGIVSAKSRRVLSSPSRPYDEFIQTDASINPGSSGGPLFNTKGQVIGIATAIFSPGRASQLGGTGFNIGIGFAIPINLAKRILEQLKDSGSVTRGLLGVLIQEVEPEMLDLMKLPGQDGALVSDVKKDTPAEKAGFKRRDLIVAFNGHPVRNYNELPLMVASTEVGSEAEVKVIREGKELVLKPVIGVLKQEAKGKEPKNKDKPDRLGLILKDITPELAKTMEHYQGRGVLIDSIKAGSVAEKARVLRGDILEEIGDTEVKDAAGASKIIDKLAEESPVIFLVRRKEGAYFVSLKPEAEKKKQ